MEEFYLNKTLTNDGIVKTLSEAFPELEVFHYDFSEEPPEKLDLEILGFDKKAQMINH